MSKESYDNQPNTRESNEAYDNLQHNSQQSRESSQTNSEYRSTTKEEIDQITNEAKSRATAETNESQAEKINNQIHSNPSNSTPYIDKSVKKQALSQELAQIRQELTKSDRLLSKTIHQPKIQKLSEISAKTVARPYGLIVGGLLAFIGSLAYYLFTKYYGLHYYSIVFIILFISGYILSSLIEIIVKSIAKKA